MSWRRHRDDEGGREDERTGELAEDEDDGRGDQGEGDCRVERVGGWAGVPGAEGVDRVGRGEGRGEGRDRGDERVVCVVRGEWVEERHGCVHSVVVQRRVRW